MIQRIQSIYLLAVIILSSQTFLFPFLLFFNEKESISFNAIAISNGEHILPLTIIFGVIILIAFATIFLYKNRLLQARLTVINMLLLLGSIGLISYFGWQIKESLPTYVIKYNFPCLFPIIAVIFDYLALRAIRKDEALVRSANRLRS